MWLTQGARGRVAVMAPGSVDRLWPESWCRFYSWLRRWSARVGRGHSFKSCVVGISFRWTLAVEQGAGIRYCNRRGSGYTARWSQTESDRQCVSVEEVSWWDAWSILQTGSAKRGLLEEECQKGLSGCDVETCSGSECTWTGYLGSPFCQPCPCADNVLSEEDMTRGGLR